MNVVHQLADVNCSSPLALTAGSFDGVHHGHQALISDAIEQARNAGGQAWLLTFNPHPARLLAPSRAPRLLMTDEQRHEQFRELGLHGCIELPFGQQLAETEAESFILNLCKELPTLHSLTVGPNWTFGYHAIGTTTLLQSMAAELGFEARIIEPIRDQDELVSSSRIRTCIANGDLERAQTLLGRPYVLSGIVVRGKQEGRELGFPTANVQFDQECQPAEGIYACTAFYKDQPYPGAGYFMRGQEKKKPVFEVHLIGQDVDLYGQSLKCTLHRKMRGHQSFSTKKALISGIQADITAIDAWLTAHPSS